MQSNTVGVEAIVGDEVRSPTPDREAIIWMRDRTKAFFQHSVALSDTEFRKRAVTLLTDWLVRSEDWEVTNEDV